MPCSSSSTDPCVAANPASIAWPACAMPTHSSAATDHSARRTAHGQASRHRAEPTHRPRPWFVLRSLALLARQNVGASATLVRRALSQGTQI